MPHFNGNRQNQTPNTFSGYGPGKLIAIHAYKFEMLTACRF